MNSSEDIYKGNNASDYQPPTQNPQSAATNLQQSNSGVQPTDTQSDISQQRLPSVDQLKVMIIQDGASTTRADLTPVQKATQTWMGPFWGCVVLGMVIIIVWAVRVLAKEEAPNLGEALGEAIHEPLVAEETPALSAKPVKKKKTAAKKTTKKKKPTKRRK